MLLIAPPTIAAECTPHGRAYSIHPPFLGQVDGMHPDYREKKTQDHAVADAILAKPKAIM